MSSFYLAIIVMFAGFLVIALLIFKEKGKDPSSEKGSPASSSGPPITTAEILGRLGLESPSANSNAALNPAKPKTAGRLPWENFFKKKDVALPLPPAPQPQSAPQRGTIAMTIEPYMIAEAAQITKHESELSLKYDELQVQYKELEEKYNRLDALFHEKSDNLEKTEKSLAYETKTHKEFNKVKDILEKELKETKDRCRNLQADVTSAQTEADTHLKRVNQLEEKIKKLEISILSSEAAINDAQAETQVARKRIGELEERLRNAESQMQEKNRKIEDLVNKLKGPGPTTSDGKPAELPEEKIPQPDKPDSAAVMSIEDSLSLPPDVLAPPQTPVLVNQQQTAPENPVPSQNQENNPSETQQPKEPNDAR